MPAISPGTCAAWRPTPSRPWLIRELAEARIAWRPIPADGFPSVGAASGVRGYYEAVTHSGITLGAIVGRVLAQEIIDGTVDDLIAAYRPDRRTDARAPLTT